MPLCMQCETGSEQGTETELKAFSLRASGNKVKPTLSYFTVGGYDKNLCTIDREIELMPWPNPNTPARVGGDQ